MKITATQLKQIIAEEVSNVMNEAPGGKNLGTQNLEYIIGDLLQGTQFNLSHAREIIRIAGLNNDIGFMLSALKDDPDYKIAAQQFRKLLPR